MQLILGTANLGSIYSLNQKNKIKKIFFFNIIKFAIKNKIKTFDTAPKYKNAEKILGEFNYNKLNIITKISNVNHKDLKKKIFNEILESKKKLKVTKIYGLLIHDINFFRKNNSKQITKILAEIKKKGIVKKIGFSVYDPRDIDFILKFIKPDLVQLPLSLFDRRFVLTKKIKKLHSMGIKVHVRSIFMRGVLLADYQKIPKELNNFKSYLAKLNKWCNQNKTTKLQATVNYIKTIKNIDAVVIGVDNTDQLSKIILAFKNSSTKFPQNINLNIPKKYLDIRKWKI